MGFKTQDNHFGLSAQSIQQAQVQFQKNSMQTQALISSLPNNRDLLKKIKRYGLQTV